MPSADVSRLTVVRYAGSRYRLRSAGFCHVVAGSVASAPHTSGCAVLLLRAAGCDDADDGAVARPASAASATNAATARQTRVVRRRRTPSYSHQRLPRGDKPKRLPKTPIDIVFHALRRPTVPTDRSLSYGLSDGSSHFDLRARRFSAIVFRDVRIPQGEHNETLTTGWRGWSSHRTRQHVRCTCFCAGRPIAVDRPSR